MLIFHAPSQKEFFFSFVSFLQRWSHADWMTVVEGVEHTNLNLPFFAPGPLSCCPSSSHLGPPWPLLYRLSLGLNCRREPAFFFSLSLPGNLKGPITTLSYKKSKDRLPLWFSNNTSVYIRRVLYVNGMNGWYIE